MKRILLGAARIVAAVAVVLGTWRMAFAATDCGTMFQYDAANGKYTASGFPCAALPCDTGLTCRLFGTPVGGVYYYNCFCPIGAYGGPYQPLINTECAPGFATANGAEPDGTNSANGTAACFNNNCVSPKNCHFALVPVNPPPGYIAPLEDTLPPAYTGAPGQCRWFTLVCSCH